MPDSTLNAQSLEIVALWEDAVCLHTLQKSLIPADLVRAKKHLAQMSSENGAQPPGHQPFIFYRVCVILARQNGSATMGELSDALGVPLSTATRLLNRLAHGGYLERLTDPTDRRIVRVMLTPRGKTLYKTIHEFAQQRVEAILHHLTAHERKEFVSLLHKAALAWADTTPQFSNAIPESQNTDRRKTSPC